MCNEGHLKDSENKKTTKINEVHKNPTSLKIERREEGDSENRNGCSFHTLSEHFMSCENIRCEESDFSYTKTMPTSRNDGLEGCRD